MLGSEAQEPSETSGSGKIPDKFHNGFSIKTQLAIMAVAITSALAAAFMVTTAGLNYVENIHMAAIRNENVFHELMEIKASALSTIMLEPASPDTESVFAEAGRKIQHSSRSALENTVQPQMRRGLEVILSQWREYEQDSKELITLSGNDPKAAKEGVVRLYKRKFIPFQENLESLIAQWLEMATRIEHDAAESIQLVRWSVSFLILFITAAVIAMMLIIARSINANIREREENHRQLLQAKEAAEDATKLKDKFVSLVAHDLKSPLAGIVGFLQLYRKDETRPLENNGSMEVLDRAIDSGKQLARLIDDLLNLNRLKTGQLKLDKEIFDAKYLGAKMCADFSYAAESKGIKLINLIPAGSGVFADKTLLGEALLNLVTNAIKFCREGDTITISFAESDRSAIQVKDTGPGMHPEKLARLFNYGAKVSTVGTGGETGTGFGLGLAKDIMRLHGGDLEVASEAGKGCVCTLTLPLCPPVRSSAR